MKLRVYLDTSVLSAYFDDRNPERMLDTRELWFRLADFEVSVSSLVREEIGQTADDARRSQILGLLDGLETHAVSDEMHALTRAYLGYGLFGEAMYNDALHIAVAVLTRQDVLVSWNFRHLVNRRKRAQVDEINARLDLPTIEILAPVEL